VDDLDADGYAIGDIGLAEHQCAHLASSLPAVIGAGHGGVRNLITHPTVVALLSHERLGKFLWTLIGRDLVAVKATLFDKTTEANWRVQWHQDRTVAVKERLDVQGYGPWSTKSGALHVEAPEEVLAQMLAIRIYLDECGPENGPLRVVRGSHHLGKLTAEDIEQVVADGPIMDLPVRRGGFLLMRPLLVHASAAARAPEHRRVLHIEFAPKEAISPLKWHETVTLYRAA
jgi:ectoine hydroxylase-related dioxygenase (phytanoyl-CoA dioxygenase family)